MESKDLISKLTGRSPSERPPRVRKQKSEDKKQGPPARGEADVFLERVLATGKGAIELAQEWDAHHQRDVAEMQRRFGEVGLDKVLDAEVISREVGKMAEDVALLLVPEDAYRPVDGAYKEQLQQRAGKDDQRLEAFLARACALEEGIVAALDSEVTPTTHAFARAQATLRKEQTESDLHRVVFDVMAVRAQNEMEREAASEAADLNSAAAEERARGGAKATGVSVNEAVLSRLKVLLPDSPKQRRVTIKRWIKKNTNIETKDSEQVTPDEMEIYLEYVEVEKKKILTQQRREEEMRVSAQVARSSAPSSNKLFNYQKLANAALKKGQAEKTGADDPPITNEGKKQVENFGQEDNFDEALQAFLEGIVGKQFATGLGISLGLGSQFDEEAGEEVFFENEPESVREQLEREEEEQQRADERFAQEMGSLSMAKATGAEGKAAAALPGSDSELRAQIEEAMEQMTRREQHSATATLIRLMQTASATGQGYGLQPMGRFIQRMRRWLEKLPRGIGDWLVGTRFMRKLKAGAIVSLLLISAGFGAYMFGDTILSPFQSLTSNLFTLIQPVYSAVNDAIAFLLRNTTERARLFFALQEAEVAETAYEFRLSPNNVGPLGSSVWASYLKRSLQPRAGRELGAQLGDRPRGQCLRGAGVLLEEMAQVTLPQFTKDDGILWGVFGANKVDYRGYFSNILEAMLLSPSLGTERRTFIGNMKKLCLSSDAKQQLEGYAKLGNFLATAPAEELDRLYSAGGDLVAQQTDSFLLDAMKAPDVAKEKMEELLGPTSDSWGVRWKNIASFLPVSEVVSNRLLAWLYQVGQRDQLAKILSDENVRRLMEDGYLVFSTERFMRRLANNEAADRAPVRQLEGYEDLKVEAPRLGYPRLKARDLPDTTVASKLAEIMPRVHAGDPAAIEDFNDLMALKREGEREQELERRAGLVMDAAPERRAVPAQQRELEEDIKQQQRLLNIESRAAALIPLRDTPGAGQLVPYDPETDKSRAFVPYGGAGAGVLGAALAGPVGGVGAYVGTKLGAWGIDFASEAVLAAASYYGMSVTTSEVLKMLRVHPVLTTGLTLGVGGLSMATIGRLRLPTAVVASLMGGAVGASAGAPLIGAAGGVLLTQMISRARGTVTTLNDSLFYPMLSTALSVVKGRNIGLIQQETAMQKMEGEKRLSVRNMLDVFRPMMHTLLPQIVRSILFSAVSLRMGNLFEALPLALGTSGILQLIGTTGFVLSFSSWAKAVGGAITGAIEKVLALLFQLTFGGMSSAEELPDGASRAVEDSKLARRVVESFTRSFRRFMVWTNEFGVMVGSAVPIASALRVLVSTFFTFGMPLASVENMAVALASQGLSFAAGAVTSPWRYATWMWGWASGESWADVWRRQAVDFSARGGGAPLTPVLTGFYQSVSQLLATVLGRFNLSSNTADTAISVFENLKNITSAATALGTNLAVSPYLVVFTLAATTMVAMTVNWIINQLMGLLPSESVARSLVGATAMTGAQIMVPLLCYVVGAPLFNDIVAGIPMTSQTLLSGSEGFDPVSLNALSPLGSKNTTVGDYFLTAMGALKDKRRFADRLLGFTFKRLDVLRMLFNSQPTIDPAAMDDFETLEREADMEEIEEFGDSPQLHVDNAMLDSQDMFLGMLGFHNLFWMGNKP